VLGKLTASGKFIPSPATAADGSETAIAVLVGSVDATSADVVAVAVTRHAEVNRYGLFYDALIGIPIVGWKAAQMQPIGTTTPFGSTG
jgi:hypothetical protein